MLYTRKLKEVNCLAKVKYWASFPDLTIFTSHGHKAYHYIQPNRPNINSKKKLWLFYLLLLLDSTQIRMQVIQEGADGQFGIII